MNEKRKQRLALVSVILLSAGAIVGLVTYALRQNINLFYTPSQIAQQQMPQRTRIRVGGLVKKGSVHRSVQQSIQQNILQQQGISNDKEVDKKLGKELDKERMERPIIHFQITDLNHSLEIQFNGLLPDLFREGQGIIALGKLNPQGIFMAEEILAKHDENYMPPEIADTVTTISKEP